MWPAIPTITATFTTFLSYIGAKIASDTAFKLVVYSVGTIFLGFFVSFFIWVFNQVSNIYQYLKSFFALDFTTNNEMLLNVLGGVNCIGIFSGFNSGIDLIMTALVFRVLLFLGKYFLAVAFMFYKVFTDVMSARAT